MQASGLLDYQLPAAGRIWWVPRDLGEGKRISFKWTDASEGWRILVGKSDRLERYWHFGVYAVPTLKELARFVLRPHVIFSRNGVLEGGKLRRTFCKNWFNARWRDLLFAFVQLISDGRDTIELPVGGEDSIVVDARPLILDSPVRIPASLDRSARQGPTEEGDIDDDDGLDRQSDSFFRSLDDDADDAVDEDDEIDEPKGQL